MLCGRVSRTNDRQMFIIKAHSYTRNRMNLHRKEHSSLSMKSKNTVKNILF